MRVFPGALVAALVLIPLSAPDVQGHKKNVAIVKTWRGSVLDIRAPQPGCITSAKGLDAIWKAWNVKGEVPMVDFSKEIVVAIYSMGSILNVAEVSLDDKGNLIVLGVATRDIRAGFRYVLATVSRDGVKTVNGNELPKE